MSDLEYYAWIAFFIAGPILLVYLFKIRKKLIRKARIQLNLAKAKLHHMTRPTEAGPDIWGDASSRKREIR